MLQREILHVQLVGLHAAAAVAGRPELASEPFVIAHSTPGARVMDVSPLAHARGIRIGSAVWEVRAMLGQVTAIAPDLQAYTTRRADAIDVMLRYTPQLQPLGNDQVFLDVTGSLRMCGGLDALLERLRADLVEEIGILPAVGIAPNPLLARIANAVGSPMGINHLPCQPTREGLANLPVELLWVVETRHRERLRQMGVSTFGQLSCLASYLLMQEFGPIGKTMFEACRGRDETVLPVFELGDPRLAIRHELDLARPTREADALRLSGLALAQRVAHSLRKRKQSTRKLQLTLRMRDRKQLHRAHRLAAPADLEVQIVECVDEMLDSLDLGAGHCLWMELAALDLREGPGAYQPSLFDTRPQGQPDLAAARDRIPEKTRGSHVVPGSLVHSPAARPAA